ncbi:KilA-N domain-containing protein [Pseudomonas syringae]|uniref:Succinate dehydrogenase/fumarate reductase n=1 Tax=Pseudomonas syringae pv. actinidiae TaxID=103796 RepID=A0A2V0QRI4_PSESF|nr:KilA-N domain-containing protein [Pseudomonas syringae]EPM91879.1 hypothetical protein A259_38121 [Pseudomonas syringae pv. actinidiae ICMP 19070]EPM81437.1 hypothetical protein A260_28926 [Pseudomonas syringae pv. actinidiae ICMP 19068]NVL26461.1 DNA-binding protein [Pseudomonas syringae pv. actinidiae]NVL30065.1 DNA-binding protein [Pseudomonas syringae pv. actinidiae]NVL34141.1 DNA-binding protein [Pseudomonas syringae pv. actinidiae]
MNNVIPFDYQGREIRFSSEGWIDATDAARKFAKRPADWLRLPSSQSYLKALAKALGVETEVGKSHFGLVLTIRGGKSQGSWIHPKLAVAFARWLEDDFAVWCDLQIDALLRGDQSAIARFHRACKKFDDCKSLASDSGRNLNAWRREKPGLICEIERGRELLQMTLGLNHPTQSSDQQALA